MRVVLRVRRKGVLILPKRLREEIGLREDDEVIVETRGKSLVIKPLRPLVVDIDPELVEEILEEERGLEEKRYRVRLGVEETST